MNVIAGWPRIMEPDVAVAYAGGPKIFDDLVKKKLLKPRIQQKGLTRYDRSDLDAALDRWKGFST